MPAKKKSVTTPLHLLQQLSDTLIEHLDKACQLALKDAEGMLAKLEKQRGKAQDRLSKARAKLDEAGSAGRTKAQGKARARIGELEELIALLQARQSDVLGYIAELKRDIAQSLHLAQGVRQVGESAGKALQARNQPPAAAPKTATAARKLAPKTKPAASTAAKAVGKPAASRTSPAKPAAAVKAPASKPGSTPKSPAATRPATKKPAAASKPAAEKAPASKPAASKPAVRKPAAASKPPAAKKPVARKSTETGAAPTQAPLNSR